MEKIFVIMSKRGEKARAIAAFDKEGEALILRAELEKQVDDLFIHSTYSVEKIDLFKAVK